MIRAGLVTRDGQGEIVTGLVMMLIGENSRQVVERRQGRDRRAPEEPAAGRDDRAALRPHPPDRPDARARCCTTWSEGGVLVIVVLLVLLGNLRGGLIVALAIPLSMLFAANVMLATGVTASLMSLGAIDFGLIVDSSVIMIENCVRRLAHEGGTRPKLDIIRDAAIEVRKPTMFGELIIAIVYLPILALQGTEGKLFRPMALTVIFALAGSMVLSLTLMPVLASLGPESKAEEKEVWLIRGAQAAYTPVLDAVIRRPVVAALLAVGAGRRQRAGRAANLGGEFMPRLNEGDLLIEAVRIPSASLEGAVPASTQIENILKTIPEVRLVYCKTGRPEIANDVMGVHQTDVWTMLKPQDEWRPGLTRDALIEEMDKAADRERPRREVRLQPADRDAGQRAGRGRQERRGRADLRPRPRRAPAEGDRDRAGAVAHPRGAGHQDADLGPPADAPDLGPPRPARPVRDQGVRRARRRRRAGRHDGRHRLRGADPASASRSACPQSWRNDPEKIELDPDRRHPGPADRAAATWPTSRFEEGPSEVERENVQRRAVRRRQRPGPRHRRVRRRGPGRDRVQGQAARPATSSAGAASSSTCRRPRGGW